MNLVFAIMGIIGGLFTATGDMLLDLKGKGNQKLGIVTSLIGWGLRALNKDVFYDMPAIIMSSVGTSLMCVVSVVSIL